MRSLMRISPSESMTTPCVFCPVGRSSSTILDTVPEMLAWMGAHTYLSLSPTTSPTLTLSPNLDGGNAGRSQMLLHGQNHLIGTGHDDRFQLSSILSVRHMRSLRACGKAGWGNRSSSFFPIVSFPSSLNRAVKSVPSGADARPASCQEVLASSAAKGAAPARLWLSARL